MTGAEIVLKCLEEEDVDVVFGYPGGAVLNIYDALYKNENIRHILSRHEQGAGHAAEGYAKASGRVGVVIATSGPGATNMVTSIANAQMDSTPLVVITGQVNQGLLGKQSFQEANITEIVKPITKYTVLIDNIKEISSEIQKAFRIANSGRKGPVLIDIPKDITGERYEFNYVRELGKKSEKIGDSSNKYAEAMDLLRDAKYPLIYVGGGVKGAQDEISELVKMTNTPLVYSLMGKGAYHDREPLNLGMIGMHGTALANKALSKCDFLLGIGVRFDDRATGHVENFAKNAKIIHIDIDKGELRKNIPTYINIHDDSGFALLKLIRLGAEMSFPKRDLWFSRLELWKEQHPTVLKREGKIKPQEVMEAVNIVSGGNGYVTTEVGQHQMWAAQYISVKSQSRFITSGGLGTMGFGLPAAIGAQVAHEDKMVFALCGDGSIQMNSQELMTISANRLPIVIIILNNKSLGMVKQWQKIFYEGRLSETTFTEDSQPDFVALGKAYGIKSYKIDKREVLLEAITKSVEKREPILLEIMCDEEENVYPMVPAGASNEDMLYED